jgi:hypothetical protein
VLLGEPDIIVVHLLVANAVHEAFDASLDQELGVGEVEHVRHRMQPELFGLVCRGGKHFRRELRGAPVAVVDPDFHEIGLERRKLAHGGARLLRVGHGKRHVVARRVGRPRARKSEPAPDRENARGIRDLLLAQLECEVAEIGAGRDHRDHAVIGVALEVIDVIFTREVLFRHRAGDHVEEARMAVGVDDARDHGLAGKIDSRPTGRRRNVALAADLRDPVADNEERGILNRRRAVSGDKLGPFVQGCGLLRGRGQREDDERECQEVVHRF